MNKSNNPNYKTMKKSLLGVNFPTISFVKNIKLLSLLFVFTFFTSITFSQTTDTYTTSGNWIVPAGVTSVTVQIWGAGGGGGGSNTAATNFGGSGGGSGAYVSRIITVSPGTYAFTIGTGGTGGIAAGGTGGAGGNSTITIGGFTLTANGGTGGTGNTGAAGIGGTGTGGTTNTNGNSGIVGGAIGGAGGNAPNGGTGGTGGSNSDGISGTTPGGGGGGGERGGGSSRAGGVGARGEIRFTYTLPASYCTPTNTYSTSYYISGVTTTGGIANINNTPTAFSAYTNYSSLFVSQVAGSNFSLNATHPSSTYGYSVWIDWNNDSDFNDAGENVLSTGYLNTPASLGTITIPPAQPVGNYRMRIRNAYLSNPAPACGAFDYGEAEDYTVQVVAPSACSGMPNAGTMHMNRTVNMRRLDYVYWSSPVTSFASSAISPGTPTSYIYKWTPTIGTNINGFGNWALGNENMVVGKGYIVRGPNAFTTTPAPFTATFTGTPNNGVITTPILRGNWNGGTYSTGVSTTLGTNYDDNWNLIGNPYPSAVNAISFLTANTNIDGFIKIWTHGTLPSTAIADPFYSDYMYNYTPGDYITYNSSGTSSGPGVFNGNIASGQGFFVSMLHTTGSTSENITFNNSMRNTLNSNSQFFRSSTNRNSENDGRIWLDLIDSNLNSVRNLIGYIDGATNSRDRLFDAITDEKLNLNLYSKIGTEPMTIQGRTLPFDEYDLVPMGIKVPQDGNYSIGIGAVDGFFTNTSQNIFLEDLDTNIIHDLRQNPYSFTAVAGDDSDRFILRFTNNTLGNEDITNEEVNVWAITSDNLSIKSTKSTIQSVRVFDILGRLLADYQNVNGYEIPLTKIQKNNAALIVQVTLTNGAIVNKKIIY